MGEQPRTAEAALDRLHSDVETRRYEDDIAETSRRGWGGADVVITSEPPARGEGAFYAEPRAVVTPHAAELAWLFDRLGPAFRGLIDSATKIEFYGRLANAAISFQKKSTAEEVRAPQLLGAVLDEARAMLKEMKDGELEYLGVAPGGVIASDLEEAGEETT